MTDFSEQILKELQEEIKNFKKCRELSKTPDNSMRDLADNIIGSFFYMKEGNVKEVVRELCKNYYEREVNNSFRAKFWLFISYFSKDLTSGQVKQTGLIILDRYTPDDFHNKFVQGQEREMIQYVSENWKHRVSSKS